MSGTCVKCGGNLDLDPVVEDYFGSEGMLCEGCYQAQRMEILARRTWQERVNASLNLAELAEVLNAASEELGAEIESYIDTINLPTFGGEEPPITFEGIWSWDDKNFLTGERHKWVIDSRDNWS